MLTAIKVLDYEGEEYLKDINCMEVEELDMVDPRNSKAGTVIIFKSGRKLISPEEKYVIHKDLMATYDRLQTLVYASLVSQAAKDFKPKRGKKS